MMRVDILTIFPEMFDPMRVSLSGRAMKRGIIDFHVHDLRDFSVERSRQVDDSPYGGGAGMVISLPPVARALEQLRNLGPPDRRPHVVLMTPQGGTLRQKDLDALSRRDWLVFLCGRYEGFDERVVTLGLVDEEISIGDYVLGGGELPAMVVLEGLFRLVPGVVGNRDSVSEDSFTTTGLLDYPHYTRPEEYLEERVPDVLLSGDQHAIRTWRRQMALKRTLKRRPDLLDGAQLTEDDLKYLKEMGYEPPRS